MNGSLCAARFSFPAIHPDYGIELASYNAGERGNPPCEGCACEILDGGLSGARLCLDCVADLMNMRFLAPRSRTGRRWKWSGRVLGERFQLLPQGGDWPSHGGGVRPVWPTLDELRGWQVDA